MLQERSYVLTEFHIKEPALIVAENINGSLDPKVKVNGSTLRVRKDGLIKLGPPPR